MKVLLPEQYIARSKRPLQFLNLVKEDLRFSSKREKDTDRIPCPFSKVRIRQAGKDHKHKHQLQTLVFLIGQAPDIIPFKRKNDPPLCPFGHQADHHKNGPKNKEPMHVRPDNLNQNNSR